MSNFLRTAALTATVAAFALSATQAAAAPVSATTDASAKARIIKPLTLASKQDLDLGTIVLAGAGTYTATVKIDETGAFDCDGNSGNVTCSNPHQDAVYHITGTNGQSVTIAAGPVTMSGSNGGSLTLTPLFTAVQTLTNSGGAGMDFNVGGSLPVTDSTTDGVYTGTFAVTADYN